MSPDIWKQAISNDFNVSETIIQLDSKLFQDLNGDDYDIVLLIMRLDRDLGIELSDQVVDLQRQEELTVGLHIELTVEKIVIKPDYEEIVVILNFYFCNKT